MRRLVYTVLMLTASLVAQAQPWTGILAPERAIDWTTVGIPGGIPVRNTVCATLTSSATTAQVQAAIDGCTPGQVVSFGAGTFNIGTINVRKSITLRGQGPNSTYLNVSGRVQLGQDISWSISSAGSVAWTGGLTRGSTVLTVASTAGLVAGQTIILDELNRPWVNVIGYNDTAPCSANQCGRNDAAPYFGNNVSHGFRAQFQMNKIVSVDSATQVTVKDPVSYTHVSGSYPQLFWWTYGSQKGNWEGAGIENMKVYSNGNAYTVDIAFCDYCYARNLSISQNARSAIRTYWSYGFVIANNYFSSTNCGAPQQYGIEILSSSMGLVENNILYTITSPLMPQSNFGIVFAYNYSLNRSGILCVSDPARDIQFADMAPHLAHSSFLLWEGNENHTLDYDVIWGSASHGTLFRNRINGYAPGKVQTTRVAEISAWNRYTNVVANVLGTAGYHTQYSCLYAGDGVNNNARTIYDVSNWHGCQGAVIGASGAGAVPTGPPYGTDPITLSSLVRWGNWDAVTYASNGNTNGVRYCTGNSTGNPACTADERGSDTTFPTLANPSTTFPASLYTKVTVPKVSCGTGLSFWKNPSTGYCPAYPPIGPDVTCSGGNCDPNAGGHAYKIPAQLCYENSAKDANGYLTAFDAAACYAPDTGTVRPNPPTGITGGP